MQLGFLPLQLANDTPGDHRMLVDALDSSLPRCAKAGERPIIVGIHSFDR